MIEVTAKRKVVTKTSGTSELHEIIEHVVNVHGFEKLTPQAAIVAIGIAFQDDNGGLVWSEADGYGWRVYSNEKNGQRKVTNRNYGL